MNMNKNSNVDYPSIVSGSGKFTDTSFPTSDALYWYDMGNEKRGDMSKIRPDWVRLSEVFDDSYSLWGTKGVRPQDIAQGSIGNCWYLAAAAALAEYPDRLERVVEDTKINNQGIYAFHFYALGVPYTQIIDDYLPLKSDTWNGGYSTIFGHVGDDKALWGPLMEKAFAKYHGNYEHIIGGWMAYGVAALNGSPFVEIDHAKDMGENELWDFMRMHDGKKNIMTAGALPPRGGNCYTKHPTGLQYCHAYSTMNTYVIPSTGEKVVLVRNPWKRNNYNGKWEFGSYKWTAEAKQVCKYDEVPHDGGFFFMSMEEYFEGFANTSMNYDTSSMHQDYFLMLDDKQEMQASGEHCTSRSCTAHTLTVTNNFSED